MIERGGIFHWIQMPFPEILKLIAFRLKYFIAFIAFFGLLRLCLMRVYGMTMGRNVYI